jgi:hypothetical protein
LAAAVIFFAEIKLRPKKLDFQLICGGDRDWVGIDAVGLNRRPTFRWRISALVVRLMFGWLEVNEQQQLEHENLQVYKVMVDEHDGVICCEKFHQK